MGGTTCRREVQLLHAIRGVEKKNCLRRNLRRLMQGSFFGVDHQDVLEFELHPEASLAAVGDILTACASRSICDRCLNLAAATEATATFFIPSSKDWEND